MRKTNFTLFGVHRTIGLALMAALMVALVWAATAQAQTPAQDQYGGPQAGGAQTKAGGGTQTKAGGGLQAQLLPATGGPPLLVYAGVLVASGAGLMLVRRIRSGE